jgi:hypothetical protein
MALANYTDLTDSIVNWTHRADLSGIIPDFIKLAEIRIAQDLNVQSLETVSIIPTVTNQQDYDFPTGMVSLVRAWINNGQDSPLTGVDADYVGYGSETGLPNNYFIEENKIKLYPTPDQVYNLNIIYKSNLNLQSSVTNDVMTKYPNVYLYASLIEACNFIGGQAIDKISLYEQRYKQAIKDANMAEDFNDGNVLQTEFPITRTTYDFRILA